MLERGVRFPALMSWVSVSCRGSDTHAPRSVSLCECAVSSLLSCALSRLCALFHVGAWCSVPGTHVLSFDYVSGFGHSHSMLWECAVSSSLSCTLFCPRVFCGVAHSSCFYRLLHSCYILCCVPRSLCISLAVCFHVVMSCVNTWLMSFLISCVFVSCSAHGWWFILLAMCLCFFVLCEHMACLVLFYVPCALISIVLTPPILLPDYWFICPTCSSLPSSIAPYIISLCLQSRVGLLSYAVYTLCPVLPCQSVFHSFCLFCLYYY